MSQHGSIIGNRALGSQMDLHNHHRFSYPGYSEILTSQARDKQIKSNDKIQSPTPSLLEFLKKEWQLPKAKVGVFSSWDNPGPGGGGWVCCKHAPLRMPVASEARRCCCFQWMKDHPDSRELIYAQGSLGHANIKSKCTS